MKFRCNKCHRSLLGSAGHDGACACGGVIEAAPPPKLRPEVVAIVKGMAFKRYGYGVGGNIAAAHFDGPLLDWMIAAHKEMVEKRLPGQGSMPGPRKGF